MRRLRPASLFALAVPAGLALALSWQLALIAAPAPSPALRLPPRPTEHRLDEDAERLNRKGRRAWMEEMHRAAPGTDWRALERANGLAREALHAAAGTRATAWTEIGSRNLAGRMHCAAVSVAGDSLYAGSDLGGLWKGDLAGGGWHPLSDNLYGGVRGGVAVAGVDPELITVLATSAAVRYSEDQGATWQVPAGLPASLLSALRVQRDPADPDRVYLLINSQGLFVELYRSDDAGRSYTLVNHTGGSVADFWVDRTGGGDLYLMIRDRLYRSTNLGATWTPLGSLPSVPSKVILAGSEAGAPTFYLAARLAGNWELWRSPDGGASWAYRAELDDWWETLNCSITDPNLVVYAGVEAWRSTNGGGSFTRVNGWGEYYSDPLHKLHADNPGLEVIWVPGAGERWFPCTDGGIYRSDDGMLTVSNLSLTGLGVSQYYDVLTSANNPYRIAAGSQDQGYQRADGRRDPLVGFEQLISGDYGHLTSGNGEHDIVFSVYPGFTLVQQGELVHILHYLDFPAGAESPLAAAHRRRSGKPAGLLLLRPVPLSRPVVGRRQRQLYAARPGLHGLRRQLPERLRHLAARSRSPTRRHEHGRDLVQPRPWRELAALGGPGPGRPLLPRHGPGLLAAGGRAGLAGRQRLQRTGRLPHGGRRPELDAAGRRPARHARLHARRREPGQRDALRRHRGRTLPAARRQQHLAVHRRRRPAHSLLERGGGAGHRRHALRHLRPRHLGLRYEHGDRRGRGCARGGLRADELPQSLQSADQPALQPGRAGPRAPGDRRRRGPRAAPPAGRGAVPPACRNCAGTAGATAGARCPAASTSPALRAAMAGSRAGG